MGCWDAPRFALMSCAASMLLAACAGAQSPTTALPYSSPRDAAASSIMPSSDSQTLVYASDEATGIVHVYSYPAGKSQGNLSKLSEPAGLCSDDQGNVWVVEAGADKIVRFAHGAKKVSATLTAPATQNIFSCAVDPLSGDLAVTSSNGNVLVYSGAKGSPKEYASGILPYYCGYDDAGNLFIDGINSSARFELMMLASGSSSLQSIALNGSVGFPGGVEWDGSSLAVGDQLYKGANKSAIYQISISGSSGTIEGTTLLTGSCDVLEFAIAGGEEVIAPDVCESNVSFYKYPAGGKRTRMLKGFVFPIGAAVSVPPTQDRAIAR